MIPNITRGGSAQGLMSYLEGPGKANEHTDQHLVAGNEAIVTMYGYDQLDHDTALRIGRDLDEPRRVFGTKITYSIKREDPVSGELVKESLPGHMWHCSLSIKAEEGQLTDERWGRIANDFIAQMEFVDPSGVKAECRWVAVRHGLSGNGNDHIHLAVNLVREDGTKAGTWNDFKRAQTACRELEKKYGLQQLEARSRGTGERGETRGERATAARLGTDEVQRKTLERIVRASAAAAPSEADFVRLIRHEGALVRPRFAAGRDDVVAGYSVAMRPRPGTKPVWFGGGHLARDLTLPRLRQAWPDDVTTAQAAVNEWKVTAKNTWREKPASGRRLPGELSPVMWEKYTAEMLQLNKQLTHIDIHDVSAWAHVARDTAGVFAAWSRRVEATPGPLADAARALARDAHLQAHRSAPRPAPLPSMAGAAMLLMHATPAGQKHALELMLIQQIGRVALAIRQMHQAVGDATRARDIGVHVGAVMAEIHRNLPTPNTPARPETPVAFREAPESAKEAVRIATQGLPRPGTPSPVPRRLTDPSQGPVASPTKLPNTPGTPGRSR